MIKVASFTVKKMLLTITRLDETHKLVGAREIVCSCEGKHTVVFQYMVVKRLIKAAACI